MVSAYLLHVCLFRVCLSVFVLGCVRACRSVSACACACERAYACFFTKIATACRLSFSISSLSDSVDGLQITLQTVMPAFTPNDVTMCSPIETNFLRGETRRIFCLEGAVGHYIKIELKGRKKELILCEVEIYEYKPKRKYVLILGRCLRLCGTRQINKQTWLRLQYYNINSYFCTR